ncbi:Sad1 / UNC-like C-terminal [Metschnikowia aff. pulcherrima]|uniref:SUN-like protein 1 n=1 Tax=Metschnikowia aff. pulcherrima TaxID=2163413 RepID=A0A4P6XSP4_9ASCO|nr:Sad1 / UNC-like C-terminal [Metschnikowia aff. pulcherrima]
MVKPAAYVAFLILLRVTAQTSASIDEIARETSSEKTLDLTNHHFSETKNVSARVGIIDETTPNPESVFLTDVGESLLGNAYSSEPPPTDVKLLDQHELHDILKRHMHTYDQEIGAETILEPNKGTLESFQTSGNTAFDQSDRCESTPTNLADPIVFPNGTLSEDLNTEIQSPIVPLFVSESGSAPVFHLVSHANSKPLIVSETKAQALGDSEISTTETAAESISSPEPKGPKNSSFISPEATISELRESQMESTNHHEFRDFESFLVIISGISDVTVPYATVFESTSLGSSSPDSSISFTSATIHPASSHHQISPNNSEFSDYEDSESFTGNFSNDCRFLSFEEWKKMKEAVSRLDASSQTNEEDEKSIKNSSVSSNTSTALIDPSSDTVPAFSDEHGRVYKDKFNYASVDCAATIVKTNSDAKGASAILTEVKDSYLLNKCSTANKYVVIELCQDILVESVVMGNFELFSSMFRQVKFSVSDRFPVTKGWHELGLHEAQNIRDVQTFTIENPLIWARYLKIEIVSHYGNEFYCPISLVRVHGKTMMEEFKDTDNGASVASKTPVTTTEIINSTSDLNTSLEECKVVTPYLALNEFLKDLNSSSNYCDVPLLVNVSHTTTRESNNKPTQESIFQNIVKRLSLLETNATLSLLYVEEQSKLLSDAFYNLEKRQVKKFENLLSQLNETMYTQVLYLENAVEKIKTDSRNLFRAQSQQSLTSISGLRMEAQSVAREVSFLKKVVIADTLIILSLLAYVIITRETVTMEELTSKQKVVEVALPTKEPLQVIKPFSGRNNRGKARKRKHVF